MLDQGQDSGSASPNGHPAVEDALFSLQDYREQLGDLVGLIWSIQSALGTAEHGDALVKVASDAHRAEQKMARLVRELEEVRNELEEDFDVVDGGDGQPLPNKAMRLANMIDEAIYGPGGF